MRKKIEKILKAEFDNPTEEEVRIAVSQLLTLFEKHTETGAKRKSTTCSKCGNRIDYISEISMTLTPNWEDELSAYKKSIRKEIFKLLDEWEGALGDGLYSADGLKVEVSKILDKEGGE